MNLKENCPNIKLTLVALNKLVQESAVEIGLALEGPLTAICEEAAVNRTQVYERKNQLEAALAKMTLPGPGHPLSHPVVEPDPEAEKGWRLREGVLRYRLAHPGALVLHASGRATYSDGFIRFALDLLDQWQGGSEQFSKQAEIPLQTLNYWKKKI